VKIIKNPTAYALTRMPYSSGDFFNPPATTAESGTNCKCNSIFGHWH